MLRFKRDRGSRGEKGYKKEEVRDFENKLYRFILGDNFVFICQMFLGWRIREEIWVGKGSVF